MMRISLSRDANLDESAAKSVMDLIQELHRAGATVVVERCPGRDAAKRISARSRQEKMAAKVGETGGARFERGLLQEVATDGVH
jgi:ABC-type ATPase involved in cell division